MDTEFCIDLAWGLVALLTGIGALVLAGIL